MRVIAKKRLRAFWESRKHDAKLAEKDLIAWYNLTTKDADWIHFAALKQTHPSADQVGNCVVFDVGNNRYRLIARINYRRGIVYVLAVLDHRTYDLNRWVEDCHCLQSPPKWPSTGSLPLASKPQRGKSGGRHKEK